MADDGFAAPSAEWYGTAPLVANLPNSSTPLTFFAHGSCAYQTKPQHVWRTLLSTQPELFLFNGDIVYGDCANLTSCDALPRAWRDLFANSNFRRAATTLPMMGMLDDHDYGQNDCDVSNPHKRFAKEIFLERFGVPRTDVRHRRDGLYTHRVFGPPGRRVQVVLLDTRWFRSPFVPTDCYRCRLKERYVAYNRTQSARHTILGEAQWAWLEHEVFTQPAELRLLVSTVQVLAVGHGWERWGLIPTEVDRLVRLISTSGARGVVLVSGDRHTGGIYRLPRGESFDGRTRAHGGEPAPYDLIEVTSSSLTHSFRTTSADEPASFRVGHLTHMNNFGTVRLDWEARTLTLDLRQSDDCGLSPQPWGRVCTGHNGSAGATIMDMTLNLDALAP